MLKPGVNAIDYPDGSREIIFMDLEGNKSEPTHYIRVKVSFCDPTSQYMEIIHEGRKKLVGKAYMLTVDNTVTLNDSKEVLVRIEKLR